jgi:hypothetical protein
MVISLWHEFLKVRDEKYRFSIADAVMSVPPYRLMRWAIQVVPFRDGMSGVVGLSIFAALSVDWPGRRFMASSPIIAATAALATGSCAVRSTRYAAPLLVLRFPNALCSARDASPLFFSPRMRSRRDGGDIILPWRMAILVPAANTLKNLQKTLFLTFLTLPNDSQ